MSRFKAEHINATVRDLAGNRGIGRYVFLPGSEGRAQKIAEHFSNLVVKEHEERGNLYLGTLSLEDKQELEVAAISSGMGCASLDIIVNELLGLGAKRFIRVGTAGSLQPERVKVGDLVVATAAVRDERTSTLYAPVEVPAVASAEMIMAAFQASGRWAKSRRRRVSRGCFSSRAPAFLPGAEMMIPCRDFSIFFGTVHSKDSLYAREFKAGPMSQENERYMEILKECGVLASEMESSHLFLLSSLKGAEAGTVLAIVGDDKPFASAKQARLAKERAIELSLESAKILASWELASSVRSG